MTEKKADTKTSSSSSKKRRSSSSRSSRPRPPARQPKPTTRTDGAEAIENADDPLAGDMHGHLRAAPEGAVDFYDNPPDAATGSGDEAA